jgi:hypothetical protein
MYDTLITRRIMQIRGRVKKLPALEFDELVGWLVEHGYMIPARIVPELVRVP